MCACGANGNCEGNSTTCNCDNNDEVWRQDDGLKLFSHCMQSREVYFYKFYILSILDTLLPKTLCL